MSRLLAFILLNVQIGKVLLHHPNNVCSNYEDYFYMENNPNCWYDPDIVGDAVEILANHNYPTEIYNVTTEDGYILTLYRMKRENASEVVVLQPPMTGTASNYLKSANASLAFNLYEAGYDVWLPNFRGSLYSKLHTYLTEDDIKYWDYSFHEIGVYDFPAEMELIKKVTKRNDSVVITYSMSGTSAAIYASTLPEHARSHVKAFILLGPTVYPNKATQSFLVDYFNPRKALAVMKYLRQTTAIESFELARKRIRSNCQDHSLKIMCVLGMTYNAGGTPSNFNPAIIPLIFANNPSRVSVKILHHYHQISYYDRFQFFDYGPIGNLMRYNSETPPAYPLENITVPSYIIYGEVDQSCTVEAVERIYSEFSAEAKKLGKHMVKGYNHVDYLFAVTSKSEVVDHIIDFINEKL